MEQIREIVRSIFYPFTAKPVWKQLVFGILFILTIPLFVPAIFFVGYFARVLRNTSMNEGPPEFNNWVDMLFEGLYTSIIVLAFNSIAMLSLVFGLLFVDVPPAYVLFSMIFFYIYVTPLPIILYMRRGSVRAAFDFSAIIKVYTTLPYFIAAVLSIVASAVMFVFILFVMFFFLSLPDIFAPLGIPVIAFTLYWLYIMWGALCGSASNRVLGDNRYDIQRDD